MQSRYISPSLRADARILMEVYNKIFGEPVTLSDDGMVVSMENSQTDGAGSGAGTGTQQGASSNMTAVKVPSFISEP